MDPLVREYVGYLESLVHADRQDSPYNLLLGIAWSEKFEGFVPNDENREEDGKLLRSRFEVETLTTLPRLGQCRFLEFLIGLAIRWNDAVYDYQHPDMMPEYFWTLIENLELDEFHDYYSGPGNPSVVIRESFRDVVSRNYNYDGSGGGLFPLVRPPTDQRNVEVWYQLMTYINENWEF